MKRKKYPEGNQGSVRAKLDTSCPTNYRDRLSKTAKRILEEVNKSLNPITAKQVASNTGIKPSTVSKTLQRLVKRHFIQKIFYGHYASNIYSVQVRGSMLEVGQSAAAVLSPESFFPRIHSIRFTVRDVGLLASEWELNLDVLKVKFLVHGNGTAQVFVDCDGYYSFDYISFRILVNRVLKELNVSNWDQVTVSSPEFNTDFVGLRLDGAKGVTLKALDGSFRRIYEKKHSLRDEVRVKGSLPLDQVLAIMSGGVSSYHVQQTSYLTMKHVTKITEHLDKQERCVADAVASMKRIADAVVEKIPKHTERLERVEDEIEKLKEVHSVADLPQLKRQSLFMKICVWLNRDVSIQTINLDETNPLRRLGSWMNKEVILA